MQELTVDKNIPMIVLTIYICVTNIFGPVISILCTKHHYASVKFPQFKISYDFVFTIVALWRHICIIARCI